MMKIYKILILIVLVVLFISCNKNKGTFENKELKLEDKEIFSLMKQAIDEYDLTAYNKATNIIFLKDRTFEFYYYILSMATKNNCPQAYYHLYVIMNDDVIVHHIKINEGNESMKNLSKY